MSEEKRIRLDRMRYTKNSLSSGLALLAIVTDVFYFVSVYQSDVANWYYTILIGASVLYNLIFMLMAFLASEGVKNYLRGYSWLLLFLGVGQIGRMFYLPQLAHEASIKVKGVLIPVMGDGQYAWCIVCLALSALCCIISAAVNLIRSRQLARHIASLDSQAA